MFSIIVATRNRAERLAGALTSIRNQDTEHEILVIDGASTDHTVDVARAFEVRLISEPDEGIYDAWNKGVKAARGDVVGFVNDDDELVPGALERVYEALKSRPEADVASGGYEIIEDSGTVRRSDDDDKSLRPYDVLRGAPAINRRFFRREVFERIGPFGSSYRVVGDREWLLRAVLEGVQTAPVEGIVYRYTWHSQSLTFSPDGHATYADEYLRIAREYLPRDLPAEVERQLRLRVGRDVGMRVATALRSRDYAESVQWGARGLAVVPTWPIWFMRDRRLLRGQSRSDTSPRVAR